MNSTDQTLEPEKSATGLSLDTLLFTLAVGAYLLLRLLAVDQYLLLRTLYASFLVVVLMLYILADALRGRWPRPIFLVKIALIYATALLLLFGLSAERARLRWGDGVQNTNDGLIQTEEAARMLLAGHNPYAFYEDTVLYLTGQLPTSYPMWGVGVGLMLRALRLIHSQTEYVPLWIPQVLLGLPVLTWLIIRQVRRNTLVNVWFGFAVLQLVMGYFSRIFQDNYLAMVLVLLAFAYLSDEGTCGPEGVCIQRERANWTSK